MLSGILPLPFMVRVPSSSSSQVKFSLNVPLCSVAAATLIIKSEKKTASLLNETLNRYVNVRINAIIF